MFQTPILFLVFNRPEQTKLVFEQIRNMQPAYLYVAADGPRKDKPGDVATCKEVEDIILKHIDWPCEVKTLLREENLGCGRAVSHSITWFFEQVEEGIILEDDCLPDATFFKYCEVMLERYRNNDKVMHVGGNNFQFGIRRGKGDYYFSIFGHIWGWATWRESWAKYNFNLLEEWPIAEKSYKHAFNNNEVYINYWKSIFDKMTKHEIDTWDYQWTYAIINNNGLAICPNVNLVSNIGFGKYATHAMEEPEWATVNTKKSLNKFIEPSCNSIDYEADSTTMKKIFGIQVGYLSYSEKVFCILRRARQNFLNG